MYPRCSGSICHVVCTFKSVHMTYGTYIEGMYMYDVCMMCTCTCVYAINRTRVYTHTCTLLCTPVYYGCTCAPCTCLDV